MFRTTFHRDGTVTLWNVYAQAWVRVAATEMVAAENGWHRCLAALDSREVARVERMAARERAARVAR